MDNGEERREYQKSYFDVLGICCPSEVPLVEKILNSMDGVIKVSVIVPTKTVIVVHDNLLISQLQIVRALNQARLEATVRAYGSSSATRGNWPSIYTLACGMLLAVSFLKPLFHPLKWLAVAAVLVGIPPILLRSVAAARRFTVDINILLLIAVAGSLALKDFWEAGTIVFLFTIAEWLESRATYKASAVMSSLMSMAPQKAVLADSGLTVDARDVRINTILAVKAGEVIPIDGVVVEGQCEADESSLTGESFPVAKQPQSLVWAGTNNINGYISVKTTALAEDSAAAKMTKLVEEAQNSKSRTHRMIDLCAKYYTPAIVLASVAVSVVPTAMRVPNLRHWFHLALVLLVSACPCALVLSTPVATFCALTKAATMGLLIKGGDYLEILAKTKVVAFDKTGTITRGDFTVMNFHPTTNNISKDALLYWVSSIESKSSHPMATTLVDYAISNFVGPKPENVGDFKFFPGEGIYGEIDENKIHIGNRKISTRASCRIDPSLAEETREVTVGYIFSESQLVGIFSLSDNSRTGAAQAIKEIKHLGAKTAMLTGDSKEAAAYVQNQLGNALDSVYAELLPEDKVRIIHELKTKEGTTVMVGDGMNDAPALTAADVGISMGISGSAVAMETSHITLMSNDLLKIPKAIRLAKKANRKIMENIVISVAAKGGILVLAFCGHPLLWAAVLADVGTCMLVIFNSMLLLQTSSSRGKHCCKSSHGHKSHAHGSPQQNEGKHCEQGHCGGEESFRKLIGSSHSCCSNTNHHGKAVEDRNHKSTCGRQTCNTDKVQTSKIYGADGTHSCSGHRHSDEGTTHECTISVDRGATHRHCSEHGVDGTMITDEHPTVPCHDEKLTLKCCTGERIVNVEHLTETHCGNSPCSSSHKGVEIHRREVGGCCKSYMEECREKKGCCGNKLQPLSEIITE